MNNTCKTALTAKAVKRHMKEKLMNSTFLIFLIFSFFIDLLSVMHISDTVDASFDVELSISSLQK